MKKLNVLMACMTVAVITSCGGTGTGKVTMNDVKDTISYSIGMGRAVRVYKNQLPEDIIDSVTMKQFMKGFLDAANDPEDKAKLAYALGYEIGCQEMSQAFEALSTTLFGAGETFNKSNYLSGFNDGMTENWKIMSFEEADETSNRLYNYLSQKAFDRVRIEGEEFLEKKSHEENVFKTESGLLYEVVKLGAGGKKPVESSDIEVRYKCASIDGEVYDESKEPYRFTLSGLIKGWTEGLQLMSEGDKYRFYIPSELAYGERGQGDIPPFAALVFDVELVKVY
ncbi:MAG: FKBP-type peptidyl-prolyl cis-trans isomerase [Bacteroidaceae bacterium]|nr:FKBP-type peptidyl-prolyl cis-trans isomerase [Bacteroidaceae bacterium]MBP5347314.1 FKBP-type peptidyl-prolyl cis-trans isomerase [Bacteroidaceae bacterium]MBR4594624.1 FKBP-type peptidyl-prolyl cis-trans isomerase [Bacteroidaceae bacterium]